MPPRARGVELNAMEHQHEQPGSAEELGALGGSALPSASGSEQGDQESTRLISSALSDDGRTEPFISVSTWQ